MSALLTAYYASGNVLGLGDTEVKEQISCPPGLYGLEMVVVVGRQTITRKSSQHVVYSYASWRKSKLAKGRLAES